MTYAKTSGTKTLYTTESRAVLFDPSSGSWDPETHPAVDLGLDVKWALTNIGAENPEDYGDYFAWGELSPYYSSFKPLVWKETTPKGYCWESYRFYKEAESGSVFESMTKYTEDGPETLEMADDAARSNWSAPWRMPTDEEFTSLLDDERFSWVWDGTLKGYTVTSKIPGYEGKSIFLPAAGFFLSGVSDFSYEGSYGYYWSASLDKDSVNLAKALAFTSSTKKSGSVSRGSGSVIRPVCD